MKMYKLLITLCTLLALSGVVHAAVNESDSLSHLLAESKLVVSGTIISNPAGYNSETATITYSFKFKVLEVLHGTAPKSNEIHISLSRYEIAKSDRLPLLRKGAKCVLFLGGSIPFLEPLDKRARLESPIQYPVIDRWFGIQPFSLALIAEIRRISMEERNRTTH